MAGMGDIEGADGRPMVVVGGDAKNECSWYNLGTRAPCISMHFDNVFIVFLSGVPSLTQTCVLLIGAHANE